MRFEPQRLMPQVSLGSLSPRILQSSDPKISCAEQGRWCRSRWLRPLGVSIWSAPLRMAPGPGWWRSIARRRQPDSGGHWTCSWIQRSTYASWRQGRARRSWPMSTSPASNAATASRFNGWRSVGCSARCASQRATTWSSSRRRRRLGGSAATKFFAWRRWT